MPRTKALSIAAMLLLPGFVAADDLTGANRLLCSVSTVMACGPTGECTKVSPEALNVPQFIEVDLKARQLKTTPASGENRSTEIKNLLRENGLLILQGYEKGRAFSFVIDEESGWATVGVARDGIGVSVFGACTPLPAAPESKRP